MGVLSGRRSKRIKYTCKDCRREFEDYESLKVHRRDVHNLEKSDICDCKFCNYKSEVKSTHRVDDAHKQPPSGCPICPLVLTGHINLEKHLKLHHKASICKLCPQIFSSKLDLEAHVLKQHQDGKQKWCCKICDLKFVNLDVLVEHSIHIHIFYCKICKRNFTTGAMLSFHSNTLHPEVKLQNVIKELSQCSECSKQFISQRALTAHQKIHKGDSSKPFGCNLCERKFETEWESEIHTLIEHFETDSKYKCPHCSLEHNSEENLARHIETHSVAENAITTETETSPNKRRPNILRKTNQGIKTYIAKPLSPPKRRVYSKKKPQTVVVPNVAAQSNGGEEHVRRPPIRMQRIWIAKKRIHLPAQESEATTSSNATAADSTGITSDSTEEEKNIEPKKIKRVCKKVVRVFRCESCNIMYLKEDQYLQHKQQYPCKNCALTFCKLKILNEHNDAEHKNKNRYVHLCLKCSKCYLDPKQHNNLKCPNCEFTSCTSAAVDSHCEEAHQVVVVTDDSNAASTEEEEEERETDLCTTCGSFKTDLELHNSICKC